MNPDGTAAGPAVVVAQAQKTDYDDFAMNAQGDAFLVNGPTDTVSMVDTEGNQTVIAGQAGSTAIGEPTSAQFGRTVLDNDVLYVTTAGGLGEAIGGTTIIGGQLVAVYTSGSSTKL